MTLLLQILAFLFLLGNAAVFGGFFHQRTEKSKNISNGMFLGGLVQLGALLGTFLLTKIEYDVDPNKDAWILLVISLAIAALGYFFRNDRKSNLLVWLAAGALSALALALRFIWP